MGILGQWDDLFDPSRPGQVVEMVVSSQVGSGDTRDAPTPAITAAKAITASRAGCHVASGATRQLLRRLLADGAAFDVLLHLVELGVSEAAGQESAGGGRGRGTGSFGPSNLRISRRILIRCRGLIPGPARPLTVPQATTGANTSAMRAGFRMPCCFIQESALSNWARPSSPPRISPRRRREAAA